MANTFLNTDSYSGIIFAICLAALISWLLRFLFARWDRSSLFIKDAFSMPMVILPWLIFAFYLLHLVDHRRPGNSWHDWLGLTESVFSVIFPIWMVLRLLRQLPHAQKSGQFKALNYDTVDTLSRIFQIIVVILGALLLAQKLGYSLSALLTFGGVGGLIIGMAARDWLANFFGGLMLVLDKPFKEGDWIRSPDRSIEGIVEQIGWRLTRIRTFDRRPLFIPNSLFTNIVIENPSKMRNRRVVENFGVRYEDLDKIPAIMSGIMSAFENHPDLDCSEPYYARFLKYGDSSLDCQIRVHVIPTGRVDFVRVQESIMLIIAEEVANAGADFAYPVIKYIKN